MKQKVAIIGAFVAFAVVLILVVGGGGKKKGGDKPAPGPAVGTGSGPGTAPAGKVTVEFLYSSEKKDWVDAAVVEFEKANPDVDVVATSKGSLDAATGILDGSLKPVLWSRPTR
ncbi:MAG: hypothetical protein IPH44_22520 [Myxococcales bacterium]|nr:hypothetical protein [Myxococcales bacterium]